MSDKLKIALWLLALCGALSACRTATPDPYLSIPQFTVPKEVPVTFHNYANRMIFTAYGDLYVMHANGVGVQNLTPQTAALESMPTWSPDGKFIAFVSDREGNDDIYLAPASAPGDETQQINLTNHPALDRAPAWSPDGRTIAFSSYRDNSWGIYVVELVLDHSTGGDPVVMGPLRRTYNIRYDTHPAWSPDGQYITYTSDRGYFWQILQMRRDGAEQQGFPGTENMSNTAYPDWSPDGTRIALASNYQGNWEIYTLDTTGTTLLRMTDNPASDWGPRWSPDGQWIVFVSNRSGDGDLYMVRNDGSQETRLTNYPGPELFPEWEPQP
ncbi:MAG: PD40 domain-containing protein [Anaerolineae bacterium]|nr:PD40 domain-containing protein [Anaerolineae bacterium]